MWTQFWQTSQQAANAWRTSPPRAAAPVRSLIQQSQPLPQSSAASHAQSVIPSIDVSRAALATPFTASSQSSRRAPLSARPAPLSFRSGESSAREQSQQATTPFADISLIHLLIPHRLLWALRSLALCSCWADLAAARARRFSQPPPLTLYINCPSRPSPHLLHPINFPFSTPFTSVSLQCCSAPGYRRRTAGRREQFHWNFACTETNCNNLLSTSAQETC
jgi:hypothetical protein